MLTRALVGGRGQEFSIVIARLRGYDAGMDVEKTMAFILEQQAAMNVRQDSILTMIEGGMKLIAGHNRQIKALIESQERLT